MPRRLRVGKSRCRFPPPRGTSGTAWEPPARLVFSWRQASFPVDLHTEVERHRQEKETRRLLKEELKKIARSRIEGRKRRRKARAQKELIPQMPEGEPVEVAQELASP